MPAASAVAEVPMDPHGFVLGDGGVYVILSGPGHALLDTQSAPRGDLH